MRFFDFDSFQEVIHTITRNKWRSFFTAFGVFWGVFMLVVLLGIGLGFRNFFMNSMDGMATNSLYIMTQNTSEPYKGFQSNRSWSMHTKDMNIVRSRVNGIKDISPFVWLQTSNQVVRNTKNGNYNIMGYAPSYINIFPHRIMAGR